MSKRKETVLEKKWNKRVQSIDKKKLKKVRAGIDNSPPETVKLASKVNVEKNGKPQIHIHRKVQRNRLREQASFKQNDRHHCETMTSLPGEERAWVPRIWECRQPEREEHSERWIPKERARKNYERELSVPQTASGEEIHNRRHAIRKR